MSDEFDRARTRALRSAWMRSVGDLVLRRLEDLRIDRQKFIELVGSDSSVMSKIISGKRKVPKLRLDVWCDALKLSGRPLKEFRIAVQLTWAPDELRELVDALLAERIEARAAVAHYEDRVEQIFRHADVLRSQAGKILPPLDELDEIGSLLSAPRRKK